MSTKQFIRFTTDAGGLEKVLRLLQSLSQILAAWSFTNSDALFWLHLKKQFALGRRYFRFFRFLDCFQKAQDCFDSEGDWSDIVFGVGKWSFLGLYMGLESLTILDAMGIYPTSWAETFMLEANKFWFYSLVFSVVSGLLQISWLLRAHPVSRGISTALGTPSKEHEQEEAEKVRLETRLKERTLKRRLVTDLFDLFIPGHVTGWMRTETVWVGIASMVSTTLSSIDVWDRVR